MRFRFDPVSAASCISSCLSTKILDGSRRRLNWSGTRTARAEVGGEEALDATDAREVGYMLAVVKTRRLLPLRTRRAASFLRWMVGLCWAEDDLWFERSWAMPEGQVQWVKRLHLRAEGGK